METPEDYDVYTDMAELTSANLGHDIDVAVWAAQTSLRRWVGLCNELFTGTANLDAHLLGRTEALRKLLIRFLRSIRATDYLHRNRWQPEYFHRASERGTGKRLLSSLRPGDDPGHWHRLQIFCRSTSQPTKNWEQTVSQAPFIVLTGQRLMVGCTPSSS
jgi:hypothetical protein